MPDGIEWDALSPVILRLYRELDPEKHVRAMLAVLNELIPSDSIVLNLFEVPTQKYSVVTYPEDLAKPNEVELVGRYLGQSPFPPYFVSTGDAQWKMTTDFMPAEDFQATDLWRRGLRRWGINLQICGMLAFENDTAHALTINRTHRGFEEHERDLLNALHPHLVTSYLNAQAFGRARQSTSEMRGVLEAAPGGYGYIREDGRVAWIQQRARDWMAEFFAQESFREDGLPMSVRRMVDAAAKAPQYLERVHGDERMTVALTDCPMGGLILRLDRMRLAPRLTLKPISMLSTRENEVLRWMVEGKRNGEIATILEISPRTVENHVQSILESFSVENRATAIVRAMEMAGTV